jgi:hypothetical protein
MTSQTVLNELVAEGLLTPASVAAMLSKLSFHTRRELIEAGRELNPGDPLTQLVTQHTTIVTNATTRSTTNRR